MSEQDTVVVSVPGVGDVEFPSTMSMTAITQAVKRLHNESQAARKPASAEDFTPPPPESGGYLANAARAVLPSTTGSDYLEGPMYAARHPIDSIGLILNALKDAAVDQAHKAGASARGVINEPTIAGKTAEASRTLGHTAAAILPMVGPAAAHAGEQIGEGDIAGGLGTATGLLGGILAPAAISKVAPKIGVKVPGIARNTNPVEAEAVAAGKARGIPVDAATASGRPFIKRLQKRVSDSMGGSGVALKAKDAQAEALARVGDELAGSVSPNAVDAVSAGEKVRGTLTKQMQDLHGTANAAYDSLRQMEADPANTTVIEPAPAVPDPEAPGAFPVKSDAKARDLFLSALDDAKRQGYTGSPAELKVKFDEYVKSAKALKAATAEGDEYSHAALLKEIRARGGIRPYDKNYVAGAPTQKMRGEYQTSQQSNAKYYGKNAIYRNDGLGVDDMLQQLSEDPKWGVVITPDTDLIDLLHSESSKTAGGPGDLQHYLQGAGVRPGVKWWESPKPAQSIPMAVDLREAKAALRPVYERMARQMPLTQRQASPSLQALQNILEGPDHAPLSQVDTDLSAIKQISRSAVDPFRRDLSQGLAATAVQKLDEAVRAAARQVPGASDALNKGRAATIGKYDIGDVADALPKEPKAVYNRLAANGDVHLEKLRAVSEIAPERVPEIGRAFLEGLLRKAKAEGGFQRTAALQAAWQALGPETKKILFPTQAKDLDNFFLLAKRMADNPNPSGTASQMSFANLLTAIPFNVLARVLYSPGGVERITNGFRIGLPKLGVKTKAVAVASGSRPRSTGAPAPAFARDQRQQPDTSAQMEPGNIDLGNRPRVKNADGSVSTVRSISFNEDGKEILIPTVSDDGRIMTEREAIAAYHRTGKHLGIFATAAAATAYANRLHEDQARTLVSR